MSDVPTTTAVVTGASRGFGRGVATALLAAGSEVVGIARGERDLARVRAELGEGFVPVVADAIDETLAHDVVHGRRPGLLVLNAGAVPHMAPVQDQTWETFSRAWEVDTRHVLAWTRAALREPLAPGGVVVSISSGAALFGSPLSGGYAAANAAIRHVRAAAADESERAGLGLRFVTLFPQMTPLGGVGAAGVAGYAARRGIDPGTLVAEMEPVLTPEAVGAAVVDLVKNPGGAPDQLITATGLRPVD